MKETPEQRTRIMRAVKDRNSQAEMTVRRLVHAMGYRFTGRIFPGSPTLSSPGSVK
jgi:DNA mismatch endonuclease (patch repair protein)